MTNSINFNQIVNVDDASSFDRVFWLVEERGLSLGMLQAEMGIERAKEYLETRLQEIGEKITRTKASGLKRLELDEKAKYWTEFRTETLVIGEGREIECNWFNDKWFEDNAYVWSCELGYLKKQYRETKAALEELIAELEDKAAFEEYVHCGEFQKDEKVFELGVNWLHWEGARRNGMNLLTEVKFVINHGSMTDEAHVNYIKKVKKAIAHREITKLEYYKVMTYLYKWSGLTNEMRKCRDKVAEIEANQKHNSPKSDVPECNAYSMSIEDAIDLKRAAERICESHYINFEEAVAMLLEDSEQDDTFFCGCMEEQEDIWTEMAMVLS